MGVSAQALGVTVLGPVAVRTSGGLNAVRGQQGLVLAVMAAAHPHPVSTGALLDELWDDSPPPSARTALRVVLTRLRERLGAGDRIVVHSGGAYRLALGEEQLDHLQFERMLDQAGSSIEADPRRAVALLRPALELWRGAAFAPYDESPRVKAHAAHLEEQRKHAEELLVSALLAGGQPDSAATWATALVEAEPYRERRWEHLMLALYRTGRQAEALHTARRAAERLREDLGIEPWPGLRALESDILNQAPHLDRDRADDDPGAAESVRVSGGSPGAGGVPTLPGSFVDRVADVAALSLLLDRERLVSVVGPPGVGKSRLAAHLARAAVGTRVLWLDLVPVPADAVVAELANLTGIRLGQPDASRELAAAFSRNETLLVLDNCEHALESVADLAEELLAACPRLTVLVTSRQSLACPSETAYPLEPLPIDGALQLLRQRAGGHLRGNDERGAGAAGRSARPPAAVDRTRGAGARLDVGCPPGERADPLPGFGDRAWAARQPAPPPGSRAGLVARAAGGGRPRAVRHPRGAARQVPGRGRRRAHRAIAGRDRAGAAAAGGRWPAAPAGAGTQAGWRQLNVVRTHAQERLRAHGRLDRLTRAHATAQVALVKSLAGDLVGPGEDLAVARLGRAADQLPAAHHWLIAQQAVAESAAFNLALWEYTFFRQQFGRYHWLEDTLALPGADQVADHDLLLGEAALAAWARGQPVRSAYLADQAEAAAAGRGRPLPLAALKARFNLAVEEQRLGEAGALLMRLLGESIERADARHHADNLVVAAMGLAQLGLDAEAAGTAEQAVTLARTTGNPTSVSWAGVGVGSACLYTDPRRAARAFSAAARLAGTVDNRWVKGMALTGLVTALRRQGRLTQARDLVGEVTELWIRCRSAGQLARVGHEVALLLDGMGEPVAAARLLAELELVGPPYPMRGDDQERLEELALISAELTDEFAGVIVHPAADRLDQMVLRGLGALRSLSGRPRDVVR